MEAERMRHAVINQVGVDTQREVVKEEKRLRMDNQPYGNLFTTFRKIYLPITLITGLQSVLWKILMLLN
jgi:predicted Zn-dependent peptidase